MTTRTGVRSGAAQMVKYVDSLCGGLSSDKMNKIVEQSQEFLRRLKVNEQALNALKPSFEVRYVAACDLALASLGHHVSKDLAVKASGCSAKAYQTYKALAAGLLDIKNGLSVKDIGIRLGIEKAVPAASALLEFFKSDFGSAVYEGVPDDQFVACALYVACMKMKIRAPKKELVAISKLKSAGFSQLAEQMRPFYKQSETEIPPSTRKRKGDASTTRAPDDQEEPSTSKGAAAASVKENFPTFRLRTLREAFQQLREDDEAKYKKLMEQYSQRLPEIFPASPKKRAKK